MFRLLVVPVIIGILAFSIVYFVTPLLFSESDVVAVFAEFTLDLSNSVFASMPPLVASYIANLNLLAAGLTAAFLLTVTIQILVLFGDAFMLVAKGLISIFKKKPKQARPPDLPSLDIVASKVKPRPGSRVLGGGFDSLDPD